MCLLMDSERVAALCILEHYSLRSYHTRVLRSQAQLHALLLHSGAWFGVPLFCMSLGPLVMAALASSMRESADAFMLRHVAACVLGATLLFWGWCVRRSVRLTPHALAKNVGGIAVAYLYVAQPSPVWLIA
jgi:surface polysaccharide O-acyltransferase-like enzyme